MPDIQRLATSLEIKSVDTSQRLITGHAAAVGNLDRVGDVIEKGAFSRTLKANPDVLVLVGHDASRMPVGEPSSMAEDHKGLLTTSRIYKTPAGDELLEVAKQRMASGRTLGMSIGYRVAANGSKMVKGIRHLTDVDLMEYSFLASPNLAANPEATVIGVKRRKAFGGTSTVESSYEDLQTDLAEAATAASGGKYCCVVATYPDHVVVRVMDSMNGMDDSESESEYMDYPYTLGDDGEPVLGEPKPVQPAFIAGAAKAQAKPQEVPPVNVMTAEQKAALPDSAFAFTEPGALDDEQKTVPRANRHFAHHGAGGEVDQDMLQAALHDARHSELGAKALAHLLIHAKGDDAHAPEWAEGAVVSLVRAHAELGALIDDIAKNRKAMDQLHQPSHRGERLHQTIQTRIKALEATLGQVREQAESIERGEDGTAQVDLYRYAFDLLTLEEVA